MAEASYTEVFEVEREKLFQVICDYEAYPKFVSGCTQAKILKSSAGKAEVEYHVSMMKDVRYVLEHKADEKKGELTWKLKESDAMKKNNGKWKLKDLGDGETEVTYDIEIEFNFPVPGLILNKLVKGSLPKMVDSFVKKAQKVK